MREIEALAEKFSARHEALAGAVAALDEELRTVKRRHVARVRRLVGEAKAARADLVALIDTHREHFERPRTRILHGVKCGVVKGKGRIEFDDAARVCTLIRRHLADQVELLIATTERPVKPALAQLAAADLRRIGCTVAEAGDEVIAAPVAGEVDRLVEALLADEEEVGA